MKNKLQKKTKTKTEKNKKILLMFFFHFDCFLVSFWACSIFIEFFSNQCFHVHFLAREVCFMQLNKLFTVMFIVDKFSVYFCFLLFSRNKNTLQIQHTYTHINTNQKNLHHNEIHFKIHTTKPIVEFQANGSVTYTYTHT